MLISTSSWPPGGTVPAVKYTAVGEARADEWDEGSAHLCYNSTHIAHQPQENQLLRQHDSAVREMRTAWQCGVSDVRQIRFRTLPFPHRETSLDYHRVSLEL